MLVWQETEFTVLTSFCWTYKTPATDIKTNWKIYWVKLKFTYMCHKFKTNYLQFMKYFKPIWHAKCKYTCTQQLKWYIPKEKRHQLYIKRKGIGQSCYKYRPVPILCLFIHMKWPSPKYIRQSKLKSLRKDEHTNAKNALIK